MKRYGLIVIVLVLIPVLALAGLGKGRTKKQSVKPYTEDPDETGVVVSAWLTHVGLPDAGKSAHALYFQKDDLTSVNALAGAKIKWYENKDVTELLELGFDFRNDGHCTTVAPRFVVTVDDVEYSLGCASGVFTPSTEDLNWTRVRFGATEFGAAGIPVVGTINKVHMLFDEGTDAGIGFVYLDNIDINGNLIGKNGKGGPKQ